MPSPTSRRTRDRLAVALLCALITILFIDVFLGRVLYLRDLTRYYYPTKRVVHEVVRGGEFPFWDRYHAAGQPMAANAQYEVFYPPQWLIFLPDYDLGFRLHILLHIYVAAIGMYMLLRSLRLGVAASLFGSLSFALGGPFLSLMNLLPGMFAWSWIPLILLFARRFFILRRARDFATAAFFLGLQDLLFDPTVVLETSALVLALGLFHALRKTWSTRRALRAILLSVLLAAAGLVLASVQVIPLLDHVGDSARSRGLEPAMLTYWSLAPGRIAELAGPHVSGYDPFESRSYWARAWYPSEGAPFLLNLYSGILLVVLLVGGVIVFRRRRWLWWLLGSSTLFYLAALGVHGPFSLLMMHVKPLTMIRYPEKLAVASIFLLVVAAAAFFDQVLHNEQLRRTSLRVAVVVIGAAAVLLVLASLPSWPALFGAFWQIEPDHVASLAPLAKHAILGVIGRALVAALILGGLSRLTGRVVVPAMLAFVAIDLGVLSLELCPRKPSTFFDRPEVTAQLAPERLTYRLFHLAEWHTASPTALTYFAEPSLRIWMVRNGLFPRCAAIWGYQSVFDTDIDRTNLLPTIDLTNAMWNVRAKNARYVGIFAAMSNARYIAAYRPVSEAIALAHGDPTRIQPVVFVPMGDNPRYYFATQIVTIRDKEEFATKLATANFDPRVAFASFPAFLPAPAQILSVRETANSARIEIDATGRSYLVASVTPHKYWAVTIDGAPATLEVTNIGFQGVIVPPGRHLVEMRYRNPLVATGGAVSIACAVALLALVFPRRKRRR